MISIKKIMSVIAIAFAVMTIAGSGMMVTSFAAVDVDPCGAAVTDKPQGCTGILDIFKIKGDNLGTGLPALINTFGGILISIIVALSVIYLVLGAYKMISDNGDGKGFSAGKDNVKYAIIGLIVAILSYGIISFVITLVTKTTKIS